jgi:hypothetical protein
MVGEFGVNDYNFFWMANKTEDQVRSYVPSVVKRIALAVEVRTPSLSSNRNAFLLALPGKLKFSTHAALRARSFIQKFVCLEPSPVRIGSLICTNI